MKFYPKLGENLKSDVNNLKFDSKIFLISRIQNVILMQKICKLNLQAAYFIIFLLAFITVINIKDTNLWLIACHSKESSVI